LQLGLDRGVQIFEALAAMSDQRRAKGTEGLFADFDGTRYVQFDV
jgi:hypothetical protein